MPGRKELGHRGKGEDYFLNSFDKASGDGGEGGKKSRSPSIPNTNIFYTGGMIRKRRTERKKHTRRQKVNLRRRGGPAPTTK